MLHSQSLSGSLSLNIDVSMEQPSRHIDFLFLDLSTPSSVWTEADSVRFLVVFLVTLTSPCPTPWEVKLIFTQQAVTEQKFRMTEKISQLQFKWINSSNTRQNYSSSPPLSLCCSQTHALCRGVWLEREVRIFKQLLHSWAVSLTHLTGFDTKKHRCVFERDVPASSVSSDSLYIDARFSNGQDKR